MGALFGRACCRGQGNSMLQWPTRQRKTAAASGRAAVGGKVAGNGSGCKARIVSGPFDIWFLVLNNLIMPTLAWALHYDTMMSLLSLPFPTLCSCRLRRCTTAGSARASQQRSWSMQQPWSTWRARCSSARNGLRPRSVNSAGGTAGMHRDGSGRHCFARGRGGSGRAVLQTCATCGAEQILGVLRSGPVHMFSCFQTLTANFPAPPAVWLWIRLRMSVRWRCLSWWRTPTRSSRCSSTWPTCVNCRCGTTDREGLGSEGHGLGRKDRDSAALSSRVSDMCCHGRGTVLLLYARRHWQRIFH